jgi:hypothetical protein
MTDYMTRVNGVYAGGGKWSFGFHVTSSQSLSALATTMTNAWASAWTNGTFGLALLYPAGTNMTSVMVASLDATMKQVFKIVTPAAHPGASGGTSTGYASSVVVSMRSTGIKRWQRGRFKLPAPDPQFVTDDRLLATPGGHVTSAVNSVKTAIQSDGSTVFVVGLKDRKLQPGTAFLKTVIDLPFETADKLGTQRNRTKGQPVTYL